MNLQDYLTVRLNHAVADGYLVANVYRLLQQEILTFVSGKRTDPDYA